MSGSIVLDEAEREALTGYKNGTKQLNTLHTRGFLRAYINRSGDVVLERTHYEAVTKGEAHGAKPAKAANLAFLRQA